MNNIIISNLNKSSGFYSLLFFLLNYYIYCKKNNINFKIESNNWLYKYKLGWEDYFEVSELGFYEFEFEFELNQSIYEHCQLIDEYSIKEYQDIIPQIYKYNQLTKQIIDNTYIQFNLIKGEYDSIFIRRGDKLANESIYLNEEKYINLLLNKNSNCKIIYLQTDDYNCYTNLKQYIINNNLNIQIYTLCDKNCFGSIIHNKYKDQLINSSQNHEQNKEYLLTIINDLNKIKNVEDMNSNEIYNHTINLLIGIDLVINSNICITDYQSNVSRFIKLAHINPNNVYDITNIDIDYNKKICPAYGF